MLEYKVTVFTGNLAWANTFNNVFIQIVGNSGESERTLLPGAGLVIGQKTTFLIRCAESLGNLILVKVDKKCQLPFVTDNWFVDKVEVTSPEGKVYKFPMYHWIKDENDHYFREGKAVRIFEEKHLLAKYSREQELKHRTGEYCWQVYKEGIPHCMTADDPCALPPEVQFSFTKDIEFKWTVAQGLLEMKLTDLDDCEEPWTDFDSIYRVFCCHKTEASDFVQKHWREDAFFGYQYLNGFNPILIRHCTSLPSNFPVTDDMVSLEGGHSLTDEMKKGHIFLCDYKLLDGVKTRLINGEVQYLTAPLVLLHKTPDDTLMPVAIQLKQTPAEDNPIFFPTDPEYDWLLAKTFVRSADFNYHELNVHLLRTHLLAEVFSVALLRSVPRVHPLYKLLVPHTRFNLQINVLARNRLISTDGAFTLNSSSGGEGMVTILQRALSSMTYSSLCIPDDITERGMDRVPNYYYRDDGLRLWDIIHRFVNGVIRYYYKSDHEVQIDSELQEYIKEIFEHGFLSNAETGDGHFGLQVLEHVIKYRWNNMAQHEKVQLKECAMQLLSSGTRSVLEEESHIKDVLSRITVEMIKREWPQHWPDMLKEMEALTSQGEAQTELVMLILLRLAEDVITFQTLPTQRRRDIQQTLTQNMDSIFSFMMAILHMNVEDYRRVKSVPGMEPKARAHCRVAVATLNTLAGYIDWVSLAHITNNNCQLLEMLCLLLSEPELQLEAAESLLIAISRKGRPDERKPFMLLFGDVAIDVILSAAQSADGLAVQKSPDGSSLEVVERRYVFLKRLCQVLCAMGSQMCFLAGSELGIEIPANLCKYTEALMAFTTHTSHLLKMSTLPTWGALFRHEILSKDPVIMEMAKKYMKTCMTNLVKTGYPSRNDHPSCMYSRVDFDNDEDFHSFSIVFRAQQSDMLRLACRIAPLEAFQIVAEWLQFQIASPVDIGDASTTSSEGMCSILSPSVIQWDAETIFMECLVGQIFKYVEAEKLPVDQSVELLQALLNYETKDPLILSCVLTNISALFPFITHRPQLLPPVLYKLFKSVTFETTQGKNVPRTRAVKNVRRHACSSIIKICRDYPDFLAPCFEMFYDHMKTLFDTDPTITYLEKCALMEAVVLISNQFKDFSKQKAFLEDLLAPVVSDWTSEELSLVLSNPTMFLSFVGADQVITEQNKEPESISCNRARLSFCLYVLSGVFKRTRWPTDLEEAKAGGFVVGYTPNGDPIYRSPCYSIFLALLPNLFALIRTQNSLFLPENLSRLSETFTRAHEIMDGDKKAVLGITQPLLDIYDSPVCKSNLERMQGFFSTVYDNCFHALGNGGQSLMQDFYSIEGLSQEISTSVFGTLDHVPDHRLRPIIRVFMAKLVQSCPPEYYESLLCPLLGPLFTYMLQRLSLKWQVINQKTLNEGEDEEEVLSHESQVTQEMLEEHLVILVTRELMEFLSMSCVTRKVPETKTESHKEEAEEDEMITDTVQAVNSAHSTELTELGKCLVKHENIYMSLLTLAFTAISWKDTTICNRTASLVCWTLLRPATVGNLLPDAVTWFFTSVLRALQVHGQHEVCNNTLNQLAMLIYESLRPRYTELRTVMTQLPDINMEALEQYDQKLLDPKAQKPGEKKRKDQFKKLIAGTIGKALCQQFRKEVHIRNLPTLFKKPKEEKDIVLQSEVLGLEALFAPSADGAL